MIEKNKKRLLYIAISVIALIIVGTFTNSVIADIYNPSEQDFLSAKADSLIGKNLNGSSFYDLLEKKGNLACFYHREGGANSINTSIHSVFDISFDNDKGEMKVYSVKNNDIGGIVSQTTYASDRVKDKNGKIIKTGQNIGKLAANAAREKNAYKVWESLKLTIADNAVVNESAIVGGDNAWGGNDNFGGSGDSSIANLSNPADEKTIAEYQQYRKIKKVTLKDKNGKNRNAKETGRTITLNNKSYTIMGPFKMTFAGKGITEVKVANATWNSSKKTEIYWKASADVKGNWTSGWSNNFNQKVANGSTQYYMNNKAFYLAVETDKLPDSGKYNISIKQDKFTYQKSRIAVTVGEMAQQMGMYCYENTPSTVEGNITWSVTRNALKTLVINKKDSATQKALTGASFKIYAELKDGTKGWVSGSAAGTKTYGKNATEYAAKVNIKNLKLGTYYIYETKAPNGYSLANQTGYHKAAAGSSSLTGDWVYVGKKSLLSSSTTVKVAATNIATPKLKITKKDSKKDIDLTETRFKIYAVLKDGTKGWVSGAANATKTIGKNADEYAPKVNIEQLKFGTYYIYETKTQEGYDIKEQEGYHKKAEGSDDLTGDWVYLGTQKIDAGSMPKSHIFEFKATNKKEIVAKLKIIKKDSKNDLDLSGAKFKIYAVLDNGTKGWVSGSVNERKTIGNNADEYDASVNIEQLKLGTYYIYETKTPEGYDITKQDGYHQKAEGSDSLTGDWVYVGAQKLAEDKIPENETIEVNVKNKKVVSELEGDVWVDEPDTKANVTDNIYKSDSKDYLKEGITVNLYSGNGTQLATTKTDSKGHYKFTTKNAQSYTDADKNIYYWDLADAYVEFIYNNKTTYNQDGSVKEYGFVAVDPFAGSDVKVNSKAQAEKITKDMLDDNKLTGTEGNNPGRAITNKDAKITDANELLKKNKAVYDEIKKNNASESLLKDVPLACYYDSTTYKVSNINLGLKEQYDADYSIDENLAYIKIRMKGYSYTYKYGESPVTTSTNVPTVNEQNTKKTFTGKIYPTDIAYDAANNTDELQVYVVYKIDVKNLETMYVDNVYTEERLYLDSLVNTYDTNRYELCSNENNSDKSDFALWNKLEDGKASYDVNNQNSAYKNGMAKEETISSYVQFKLKKEALQKILENKLTEGDIENAPTLAIASGYHEYLRTDNAWKHDNAVRAFDGVKGLNIYPTTNDAKKKYYVHKTTSKNHTSADLYLRLSLGESRKVSGTVFEDTKKDNNTALGNGILDDNEKNRAQDVTIDLLDADKTTVTKLYKTDESGKVIYNQDGTLPNAELKTTVGGTYTFDGVVPGYYYIRFTYGDGTQKLVPAGTDIKSNDYKSTIINTDANGAGDTIKNALNAKTEEINAITKVIPTQQTEEQKKLVEWYKYLNNNNYSTAVDDLTEREKVGKYQYSSDGKIYDESGNEVKQELTNVNAYTPILSISIENDKNDETNDGDLHKSDYSGFNFGLITMPSTSIDLDKKITNVKFTSQTGATLVSANPTDKSAAYITALDEVTGGSKYAKMELDKSLMYGSSLETTYEITVINNSDKDYIEDEGSDEYGNYYYYGEKTSTSKLKQVKVEEVVDELDSKYNFDSKESEFTAYKSNPDKGETETTVNITKNNSDGSTENTNTISITGWESLESGESEHMSYTVTSLLSDDNDTAYENKAKITKISLDRLTTLKSDYKWGNDTTTLSITPPTGADRRATYWIAGAIGLIVLASGIVFLKRRILKK